MVGRRGLSSTTKGKKSEHLDGKLKNGFVKDSTSICFGQRMGNGKVIYSSALLNLSCLPLQKELLIMLTSSAVKSKF